MKKLNVTLLLMVLGITQWCYGQNSNCSGCFLTELASASIIAANIPINIVNGIELAKGSQNKFNPTTGLSTGATEIALGIKGYSIDPNINVLHIAFGSLTIITSTWNLLRNKKKKNITTSWNLYRTRDKNFAISYSLSCVF